MMLSSFWFTVVLVMLSPGSPERPSAAGVVVAKAVDVLSEPDEGAFAVGRLVRGDRVTVVSRLESGWLAIEPPDGSFSWVDRDAIEEMGGGRARVVAERAAVRPGRSGARMPGAARWVLPRGATVTLLDLPPLTLRQGARVRTWHAIEAPAGEVRYVAASGVKLSARATNGSTANDEAATDEATPEPPARSAGGKLTRVSERVEPVDTSVSRLTSSASDAPLPPGLAARLAPIESLQRAILRRPVEQWQLSGVRQQYQALLDREADPASRAALQARLAQVGRQDALAKSAQSFQRLLAESRDLDRQVSQLHEHATETKTIEQVPYDAEGLLQRSSRQVDGQKVFALIGGKGETSAYLLLPPGLDAEGYLTRRVGVRGALRFNDDLRTHVISVRELDKLSDPP
jgi:hypothetical protein